MSTVCFGCEALGFSLFGVREFGGYLALKVLKPGCALSGRRNQSKGPESNAYDKDSRIGYPSLSKSPHPLKPESPGGCPTPRRPRPHPCF